MPTDPDEISKAKHERNGIQLLQVLSPDPEVLIPHSVSPLEELWPLPKAGTRQGTRKGRRKKQAAILTDTPVKDTFQGGKQAVKIKRLKTFVKTKTNVLHSKNEERKTKNRKVAKDEMQRKKTKFRRQIFHS
ncbi:hypothetical protein HNY73_006390 [Argiope bruennichi]|uniref:Uncharacterized protein n=1 Tax=Argiope bruennichi TaxID=94029 RepID=A0A8T0FS55_ARGBR|nr:hypothetical protein HNY73_006390 [Argiope bruennichi]